MLSNIRATQTQGSVLVAIGRQFMSSHYVSTACFSTPAVFWHKTGHPSAAVATKSKTLAASNRRRAAART